MWSAILQSDSLPAAIEASATLRDTRVEHFWDPGPFGALSYGRFFGNPAGKPAWDIYLLYPSGIVWDESPPPPGSYLQRGGGDEAFQYDPGRLELELMKFEE